MCRGSKAKVFMTSAAMLFSFGAGHRAPFQLIRVHLRDHHPVKILRHPYDANWTSSNWSGYAVTGGNGSVTSVSGSWTVPAVSCSGTPDGYAAFWVGIDGFTSNTVEQIGTDSDCVNLRGNKTDTPTYYAWFEFYPQASYVIQFGNGVVQPNDVIQAQVTYDGPASNRRRGGAGGQFTVTLTDVSKGLTFSTSSVVNGAKESSAEWIAEAPCCGSSGSVLPLSNFGTVSFSSATSNVSGVITAGTANLQEITMEDKSSTVVKAQPSQVGSNGDFSVAWENAGP